MKITSSNILHYSSIILHFESSSPNTDSNYPIKTYRSFYTHTFQFFALPRSMFSNETSVPLHLQGFLPEAFSGGNLFILTRAMIFSPKPDQEKAFW